MGIWSLILSLFSITTLGNAGIASGTVKFIAEYKARNDNKNLSNVLFNSMIIVLGFTSVLFFLIFIIYGLIPEKTISIEERKIIAPLIPIISSSYILAIVGRIFLSTLDGLNLIYLRSIIGIISKLFFLFFVILLVERYGLIGLATANFIQYFIIIIIGGYFMIKLINLRLKSFGKYEKNIFNKVLKYGLQFQLSSIFQMLMDPLTKFFLKDLGGLSSVGSFEVLYKIYIQIRQFIVVLVVVYLPQVSSLYETFPKKLSSLYKKVSEEISFLTFILFNVAFCFMPLFLSLLDTSYSNYLQFFSIVIFLGLIFSILGIVPYYFNAGTGDLKINTISSFLMAFTNVLFCLILGYLLNLNAEGVIIAWAISQLVANLILIIYYNKKNIMYRDDFKIKPTFFILSLLYFFLCIYINNSFDYNLHLITIINSFFLFIYLIIVYITNDLVKDFIKKIMDKIYYG